MPTFVLYCRLTERFWHVATAPSPEHACADEAIATGEEHDPAHWERVEATAPGARYRVYVPRPGWSPTTADLARLDHDEIIARVNDAGSYALKPGIAALARETLWREHLAESHGRDEKPEPPGPAPFALELDFPDLPLDDDTAPGEADAPSEEDPAPPAFTPERDEGAMLEDLIDAEAINDSDDLDSALGLEPLGASEPDAPPNMLDDDIDDDESPR